MACLKTIHDLVGFNVAWHGSGMFIVYLTLLQVFSVMIPGLTAYIYIYIYTFMCVRVAFFDAKATTQQEVPTKPYVAMNVGTKQGAAAFWSLFT